MPKYFFLFAALSLAVGLVLPGATFASSTDAPAHRHYMSPHKTQGMSRKERLKTEGLSRDKSDCAKYGCLNQN